MAVEKIGDLWISVPEITIHDVPKELFDMFPGEVTEHDIDNDPWFSKDVVFTSQADSPHISQEIKDHVVLTVKLYSLHKSEEDRRAEVFSAAL